MDASPFVGTAADELAALRRRAYGPEADIDADALRRLTELEDTERTAKSTSGDGDGDGDAEPAVSADHERTRDYLGSASPDTPTRADPPGPTTYSPEVAETRKAEASARSRFRKLREVASRRWVIAAVSVLATALVAWGITAAAADRPDTELSRVATSPADRQELAAGNLAASSGINDLTLQRYEAYGILTVWSGADDSGMRCLILQTEESVIVNASCVPRGLNPTIDYIIYDGMPSELRQDLPIGSAIRFVLRDSHVDVTTARAVTAS